MSSSKLRLVVASANVHKAQEIVAILSEQFGGGVELVPRPRDLGEVEETGSTLEENARLKAVAVLGATGIAAVADDTGLFVSALGGAPGVYSARYAGEHASYGENVEKLLSELTGQDDRRAEFRSVALVRFSDGSEVVAHGVVTGSIAATPRGENGFGYDPVFVPDEGSGATYAEMNDAEKHRISHRGRAFRELSSLLGEHFA